MDDGLQGRIAEQANHLAQLTLVAPAAQSERIDDLIGGWWLPAWTSPLGGSDRRMADVEAGDGDGGSLAGWANASTWSGSKRPPLQSETHLRHRVVAYPS